MEKKSFKKTFINRNMARCVMRLRYSLIGVLILTGAALVMPQALLAVDSNSVYDECNEVLCGAPPSGGIGGGGAGGGPVLVSFEIGPYFYLNDDTDNDGAHDIYDNCVDTPNLQGENADGDDVGDACDNCRYVTNNFQENNDWDDEDDFLGDPQGGDACDPDDDNDGILDEVDNCPFTANPDQLDQPDGDGVGNACDTDRDNDGVLNGVDNCPLVYNPDQEQDSFQYIRPGTRNCDDDFDGDNILNDDDRCPWVNGVNTDSDGDGVGDVCDNCPNDPDHYAVGDRCEQ